MPKNNAPIEPQFTRVATGMGTKLDWENDGDEFQGVFAGVHTRDVFNKEKGETETARYLSFVGADDRRYFCWETYQLREAFEELPEGAVVKVVYIGSEDIDNGRRVKNFDVFVAN